MSSVGALTRRSAAAPARSGRPPRDTTAATWVGQPAATRSAEAAPVLAPNSPTGSARVRAAIAGTAHGVAEPLGQESMSKRVSRILVLLGREQVHEQRAEAPRGAARPRRSGCAASAARSRCRARRARRRTRGGQHQPALEERLARRRSSTSGAFHRRRRRARAACGGRASRSTTSSSSTCPKFAVELADRVEVLGRVEADDLVGVGPHLLQAVGRGHRHRAHQARALRRAPRAARRSSSRRWRGRRRPR